jgi:hypothetical protein
LDIATVADIDLFGGEVVIANRAVDAVILGSLVSQGLQKGRATGARCAENNCWTGGLITGQRKRGDWTYGASRLVERHPQNLGECYEGEGAACSGFSRCS